MGRTNQIQSGKDRMPIRNIIGSTLIILSCILLLISICFPYWKFQVKAPQYPKGLSLTAYLNHLEGDIREIDMLNHYIGMRPLGQAAKVEKKLALPGLASLGLIFLSMLFFRKRSIFVVLVHLAVVLLPFIFVLDLYLWLRHFGLNLDSHAPFKNVVKPFVPAVIGSGKIAQFQSYAYFEKGFYLSLCAALLAVVSFFLRYFKSGSSTPKGENGKNAQKLFGALILLCLGLSMGLDPGEAMAAEVHVGERFAFSSINQALQEASEGDVIFVHHGIYQEALVIDKKIQLMGIRKPVIQGNGSGTVITIKAAEVTLSGFQIEKSGESLAGEDSGIVIEGADAHIENNELRDVLFGIYVKRAARSKILRNVIQGRKLPMGQRGDTIRVWYSDGTLIQGNQISEGRDAVLWYSKDLTVRDNFIRRSRYGLHFMYCNNSKVFLNQLEDNSVGTYLMYSSGIEVFRNRITKNRGASGFGIGFKDMVSASIEENIIADNKVGLYLDQTTGTFRKNYVAYNDTGLELLPSTNGIKFEANSFVDNGDQVMLENLSGRTRNDWTGNYWSDYMGYDLNQDGYGDQPYQSKKFFESVAGHHKTLKFFTGSPIIQALDFAASIFPIFAPQPKFTDSMPKMFPSIPDLPKPEYVVSWFWFFLASTFLLIPFPMFALSADKWRPFFSPAKPVFETAKQRTKTPKESFTLEVSHVTKFYGRFVAINDLSFRVRAGETIVLWGANGAGKSTLLRAVLGMHSFDGEIGLFGKSVKKSGPQIREQIGYVPQDIRLPQEHSVWNVLEFSAKIRDIPLNRVENLLKEWDLSHVKSKKIRTLSGGMKQKVGIISALLSDPELLLFDEVTSHLDAATRKDFIRSLNRLKERGKTLIFCTHRTGEILRLADQIIILDKGQKKADGKPEEVLPKIEQETQLTLVISEAEAARALAYLQEQNLTAELEGNQIFVRLPVDKKIWLLKNLFDAKITVLDFFEEREHESS